MYIKNEYGGFEELELNHRRNFTKVRGGWTKNKIVKQLKSIKTTNSKTMFLREILKFDTPEEFAKNLMYHGSYRSISNLKPSILLESNESFGGGYEQKYYSISLSRSREIASGFTGNSDYGNVASVLIKRGAVIKEIPSISDSIELEDIIEELWNEGIDVVVIGDHNKPSSEKEIAILNPKCISVGKSVGFKVFEKKSTPSYSFEELKEMWLNASENYKTESILNWERDNINFKNKYGKDRSVISWNSKQEKLYQYHKCNVEKYMLMLREEQYSKINEFVSNSSSNKKKLKI